MVTRRTALGLLASGVLPLAAQPTGNARKRPVLCVLSNALRGVGYAEMGEIVQQLGFDGVDITMMRGGLVEPALAPVDEVRAFESLHGAGLTAPICTTLLRSASDPWARTLVALAGRTGAGLFKAGFDRSNPPPVAHRAAAGLADLGAEYSTAMLIQAGSGGTGNERSGPYGLAEAQELIAGIEPEWCGVSLNSDLFDAASGSAVSALRAVMPKVKAVLVWDQTVRHLPAGGDERKFVPLGKGSVDFDELFGVLAQSGFTGPVTVRRDYVTSDEPGAIAKDGEFIRKKIDAAYSRIQPARSAPAS